MVIPKVFISYSHDSIEHKKWVLDLGTRLMHNSIDVILDQWELKPGDDLTYFMENSLREASKVLMICTKNYVKKANVGMGGVGYEKMIITSDYLKNINANKVIPIIRQEGSSDVPTFLKSKLYLPFSKDEDFEYSFDELIRSILDAPRFPKPEIGNNPFKDIKNDTDSIPNLSINELMKTIAYLYNTEKNIEPIKDDILNKMNVSNIMMDVLIEEAMDLELIRERSYFDDSSEYLLTLKGKQYCVKHGLA